MEPEYPMSATASEVVGGNRKEGKVIPAEKVLEEARNQLGILQEAVFALRSRVEPILSQGIADKPASQGNPAPFYGDSPIVLGIANLLPVIEEITAVVNETRRRAEC